MINTKRLILMGIVIIAVLSIFRNDSIEEIEFSNNLEDIVTPTELKNSPFNLIDFSVCNPDDSFSVDTALGSGGIKIIGPENDYCLVETRFELEGGYFINECLVPTKLGEMQFEGNNFDDLSSHCKLKTEDDALLELN